MSRLGRLLVLALLSAITGGCAIDRRRAGKIYFLGTEADRRLVFTAPNEYRASSGKITPTQIVCAEPSPDVAKAIAEAKSFAAAARGSGSEPQTRVQVQGEGSASYSSSRAESLAQLTNRMATIQLLRDGLYRACEAYANGAIGATTYAVILSRYDDTMITLLLGELTAGNFGQELAVLGTSAGGFSSAGTGGSPDAEAAKRKLEQAEQDVENAQTKRDAAQSALNTCEASERGKEPGGCSSEKGTLAIENNALRDAEFEQTMAASAVGSTAALSATRASSVGNKGVGGAIVGQVPSDQRGDPGEHLERIHRNYLQNINFDALSIACISALDRDYKGENTYPTLLAELCTRKLGEAITASAQMLEGKLDASAYRRLAEVILDEDSPLESLSEAFEKLDEFEARLKKLRAEAAEAQKQGQVPASAPDTHAPTVDVGGR